MTRLAKLRALSFFSLALGTTAYAAATSRSGQPTYQSLAQAKQTCVTIADQLQSLIRRIDPNAPPIYSNALEEDRPESDSIAEQDLITMGQELTDLGNLIDQATANYNDAAFFAYWQAACHKDAQLLVANAAGAAAANQPPLGLVTGADFAPTQQELNDVRTQLACPPPSGFLVNTLSNKCIDVSGQPGIRNGSTLAIWPCESSGYAQNGSRTDQIWRLDDRGYLRNQLSGRCLDVSKWQNAWTNGARLQIWDCEDSGYQPNGAATAQRWSMDDRGFIRNQLSGKCIEVSGQPGTANGSAVQLWDCENSGYSENGSPTDQRWALRLTP